jgi:hypothetical protein
VLDIMRDAPLKEQPLIPDLPAIRNDTPPGQPAESAGGIVTQPVETQVIPPQAAANESVPTPDLVASADRAIKAAESNAMQPPVKPAGKAPPSLKDFVTARGVWAGDPMIADLKALGYQRPGLIRAEKYVAGDMGSNALTASQAKRVREAVAKGDPIPVFTKSRKPATRGGMTLDGLREAAVEAGYLPEGSTISDMLEALNRDIRAPSTGGERVYALGDMQDASAWYAYQEHQAAYAQFLDTGKAPEYRSPIEDVQAKVPAKDGLFFTKENIFGLHLGPDAHGDITKELKLYAGERGFKLLPREYSEIADTLIRNEGGDAALLMERAMERELSDAEHAYLRATGDWPPSAAEPPPDYVGPGGGAAGGPETAGINAPEPGAGGAQSAGLERTSAGQQYVAPGIAPITDRQRLEAQMGAPLTGGQKAMDAGLFDMGARQQIDMFDDPGSAKARPAQMAMVNDLRDAVAKGDAGTVDLGDGPRDLADLVTELEQDADFEDVLNACRGGA